MHCQIQTYKIAEKRSITIDDIKLYAKSEKIIGTKKKKKNYWPCIRLKIPEMTKTDSMCKEKEEEDIEDNVDV